MLQQFMVVTISLGGLMVDGYLSVTPGFIPSLHRNHQAEKERFLRNQKNQNDRQKNFYFRIVYVFFVCVCIDYICVLSCRICDC